VKLYPMLSGHRASMCCPGKRKDVCPAFLFVNKPY